jgi:hypothetical protein
MPNDAVHDCRQQREDYNGAKAARGNDATFTTSGEIADGKVDPF